MKDGKANLGQIENILDYREKTKVFLEDIKKEIQLREVMKNANKQTVQLEKELSKINNKLTTVSNKLKNKTLSQESKDGLIAERNKLIEQRDNNNNKYVENQKLLEGGLNGNKIFKDVSDKKLMSFEVEAASRISKCNMIAHHLVDGKSWNYINLKLNNFKNREYKNKNRDNTVVQKFKGGKEPSTKAHNVEPKVEGNNEKESIIANGVKPKVKGNVIANGVKPKVEGNVIANDVEDNHEKKNNDQVQGTTEKIPVEGDKNGVINGHWSDGTEEAKKAEKAENFAKKHPRLAKIKNWFKEAFHENEEEMDKDEETETFVDGEKVEERKEAKEAKKAEKAKKFAEKHPILAKIINWFKQAFRGGDLLPEGQKETGERATKETIEEKTFSKRELLAELKSYDKKDFNSQAQYIGESGPEYAKAYLQKSKAYNELLRLQKKNRNAERDKYGEAYSEQSGKDYWKTKDRSNEGNERS